MADPICASHLTLSDLLLQVLGWPAKLPSRAYTHKGHSRANPAAAGRDGETESVNGAGRGEEGIAAPFFELVFRAGIVFLAAGGDFEGLLRAGFDGLGGGVLVMDDQLGDAGGFLGHTLLRREQGSGTQTIQRSQSPMSDVATTARHPHG